MPIDAEERAELFRHVFGSIPFPYFAVDVARLCDALRIAPDGPSHVGFPLTDVDDDRRGTLVAIVYQLVQTLNPPAELIMTLAHEPALLEAGVRQQFMEMASHGRNSWVQPEPGELMWNEDSLWPIAYSTLLHQLGGIVLAHSRMIRERRTAIPFARIIGEYARVMPTGLHYAFASLGAWLGGVVNVQFFSHFATGRQLDRPEVNREWARLIGYSEDEAAELDDSGLVALPAPLMDELLDAQGDRMIFGSIGIDEPNLANMPLGGLREAGAPIDGFLMDTRYRATLKARPLADHAFYGARDVLRDHYRDFYEQLEPASLVRCKHYCAPVLDVSGADELREIVAKIPLHGDRGLFFRGQPRLFTLERTDGVRRLLFGGSCAVEPSLTTSASRRRGYSYDRLHFMLRYFLGVQLLASAPGDELVAAWQEELTSPACELDYALMALAQHYGLPSHGLDVTTDLDVALWFATNALTVAAGRASYRALRPRDWPASSGDWPVVFVHQIVTHSIRPSLQDCEELDAFGFGALRPGRQHARFFLGGHGDHQNRLAESLVCVLRLPPGSAAAGIEFGQLFPSPREDPAYRAMLAFAEFAGLDGADVGVLRFHD